MLHEVDHDLAWVTYFNVCELARPSCGTHDINMYHDFFLLLYMALHSPIHSVLNHSQRT